MMRRLLGVAIVALVAVAGCGDDEPVSSGGPGPGGEDPASIEGEYLATEVLEDGDPKALVAGTEVRLRLAGDQLTASAGCNTIGGEFRVDDGVLRVAATSMTEMGCDAPRHEQDQWLVGFLSAPPEVERTEAGFVLRAGTLEITFTDEDIAVPDLALIGTTWVVDGYLDGSGPDGTASSAPGDPGKLVFEPNGFVTGNDGCNGFGYGGEAGAPPTDGLRYEVDRAEITFSGSPASTQIGCPDVDTERFWAALSGTVEWEVDGARLTLRAEDERAVTYRAAE